jgi:hypothetical protein
MRRNVLVLTLAAICGLTLAAPAVYAASPCGLLANARGGKTFAVLITGAEFQGNNPLLAQTNPTPIVGVGVIEVTYAAPPATTCPVSGELIYNDNDTITGPATCTVGGGGTAYAPSLSINTPTPVPYSGTVPCFDGSTGTLSGTAAVNASGQGNLTFTDSNSGNTFSFTIAQGLGALYFVGTSVANEADNPDILNNGLEPPVLSITGEKQGNAVLAQPFPTTWGTLPWYGETTVTCPGYGTDDSTQSPGAYGGVAGMTQVNADGSAGGWDSFNSNNNFDTVPGTTLPNDLCYDTLTGASGSAPGTNAQDGPFTDGTVNVSAVFTQPYTGACYYANLAGGFTLSAAGWGAKVTDTYAITTGSTSVLTGGAFAAPGGADYCEQQPTLTGRRKLPLKVVVPKAETIGLGFTNTSGQDCLVGITLSDGAGSTSAIPGTGDFATECSIAQAAGAQNDGGTAAGILDIYPGTTPVTVKTDPGAIQLICSYTPSEKKSAVDGIITVASPNCAEFNGAIPAPN